MADNVPITAGTGTDIATDDVGGVHYQKVKIFSGADGSSTPLFAATEDVAAGDGDSGIAAMVVRKDTPANLSGTDGDYEMLQVSGGKLWTAPLGFPVTVQTDVTRPADTTAYAVDDAISDSTSAPTTGGFTSTGIARKSGGSAWITDVIITSSNDPATRLVGEIWFFNTAVTNINDNTAFAVSDTEIKTAVLRVPFALEDAGNNGFFHAQFVNTLVTCVGSANLRFLIRAKNAYTPASGEVITVTVKAIQID